VAGGLLLFGSTNPLAVIARLVVLAASALPLAHLYEHSGQSIWPPALISAVSQAALQVVILPAHLGLVALVGWTIISAAVPQLAFMLLARHEEPARPHTEPVRPRYDH
jgi:hypothetical protein